MKTKDILLLAAVGVAAYAVMKPADTTEKIQEVIGGGGVQPFEFPEFIMPEWMGGGDGDGFKFPDFPDFPDFPEIPEVTIPDFSSYFDKFNEALDTLYLNVKEQAAATITPGDTDEASGTSLLDFLFKGTDVRMGQYQLTVPSIKWQQMEDLWSTLAGVINDGKAGLLGFVSSNDNPSLNADNWLESHGFDRVYGTTPGMGLTPTIYSDVNNGVSYESPSKFAYISPATERVITSRKMQNPNASEDRVTTPYKPRDYSRYTQIDLKPFGAKK